MHLRSKVQTELRQMKDKWWKAKAAELQQHADEHNSKKFFDGLKAVYSPSSNAMAPVRSADGTLLTEKSDIVQRWSDHFSQLLNRPSQIDQEAIQDMPQRPVLAFLDDPPRLWRKPGKLSSSSMRGKPRALMGYPLRSSRREERPSQPSSLS